VRMIMDSQPVNIYARAWPVKYITVTDICLMTNLKALMTVRDRIPLGSVLRVSGWHALNGSVDHNLCQDWLCGQQDYAVRLIAWGFVTSPSWPSVRLAT
jgi:hypothetical protein